MEFTRITLEQGERMTTVELPKDNLTYKEFMKLVESMIFSTDYKQDEINDYILHWAASIRASHEN